VIGKQLGFISTHSRHPQGPQRRFPSTRGKSNISPCGGGNRKGRGGRKDIGSPIPPTTDTPEKGQAKEEQGNQGGPSPEQAARKVGCRRVTHARHSAGTCRRSKSRNLWQKEKDRH
jgi:hypothetical protein